MLILPIRPSSVISGIQSPIMHCFHLVFAFVASGAAAVISAPSRCSPVSFEVAISAKNVVFLDIPNQNDSAAVVDYFNAALGNPSEPVFNGTVEVNGTYDVYGTYCRPSTMIDHNVLQIFVHGSSYNKSFWEGLGFGASYDWVAFANTEGYHTLALDGLSHGPNGQPLDPFGTVQVGIQIEILHQLITSFHSSTRALSRAFDRFAFVGHSLGSAIGTLLAARYPADVDAYVLTAWSNDFNTEPLIGTFAPASQIQPERFSDFPYGYLSSTNAAVRESAFYAGDFDPAIPLIDFAYQDAVTTGELLSSSLAYTEKNGYQGPVLVVTGEDDALLCSRESTSCSDTLEATLTLWPNSSAPGYYIPKNTGHNLNLHTSAISTFSFVQEWLAGVFLDRAESPLS